MRTMIGVAAAATILTGCARHEPPQDPGCIEVMRIEQQAEAARATARSRPSELTALWSQRARATDPEERREADMTYRQVRHQAEARADHARASTLEADAHRLRAELRAQGVACGRT